MTGQSQSHNRGFAFLKRFPLLSNVSLSNRFFDDSRSSSFLCAFHRQAKFVHDRNRPCWHRHRIGILRTGVLPVEAVRMDEPAHLVGLRVFGNPRSLLRSVADADLQRYAPCSVVSFFYRFWPFIETRPRKSWAIVLGRSPSNHLVMPVARLQ